MLRFSKVLFMMLFHFSAVYAQASVQEVTFDCFLVNAKKPKEIPSEIIRIKLNFETLRMSVDSMSYGGHELAELVTVTKGDTSFSAYYYKVRHESGFAVHTDSRIDRPSSEPRMHGVFGGQKFHVRYVLKNISWYHFLSGIDLVSGSATYYEGGQYSSSGKSDLGEIHSCVLR